jgi:hypothetical protein
MTGPVFHFTPPARIHFGAWQSSLTVPQELLSQWTRGLEAGVEWTSVPGLGHVRKTLTDDGDLRNPSVQALIVRLESPQRGARYLEIEVGLSGRNQHLVIGTKFTDAFGNPVAGHIDLESARDLLIRLGESGASGPARPVNSA